MIVVPEYAGSDNNWISFLYTSDALADDYLLNVLCHAGFGS
jgi:hypothetical protein